ncbi:MAG: hypothetical protein FD167_2543 [bacterium]|nr:MAG: hypothetical protein FD167_2543 [bacterium]
MSEQNAREQGQQNRRFAREAITKFFHRRNKPDVQSPTISQAMIDARSQRPEREITSRFQNIGVK